MEKFGNRPPGGSRRHPSLLLAVFDKTGRVWLPAAMQEPRIWGTLDPFVEGGEVLGRKVANTGFLDALLAADPFDAYHFFAASPGERQTLARVLAARRPDLAGAGKFKFLTRLDLPRCLSDTDYAVFHLSDCILFPAWLAALRNSLSRAVFPITATTHSLSYASFGRGFLSQLWPGTTARDAIVATSTAGLAVVSGLFAALRRGYDLDPARFPAPELARIPLGVDPAAYGRLDGEERCAARRQLGLDPEAVVLLVFGRIAHSSKMDLLPLLRAMRRVLAAGNRSRRAVPGGGRLDRGRSPGAARSDPGHPGRAFRQHRPCRLRALPGHPRRPSGRFSPWPTCSCPWPTIPRRPSA